MIDAMLWSDATRPPAPTLASESTQTQVPGDVAPARDWLPTLDQSRTPGQLPCALQIVRTLTPFILLCLALQWSYGLSLFLAVFAAGFLLRLFAIQHHCRHRALFPKRGAKRALFGLHQDAWSAGPLHAMKAQIERLWRSAFTQAEKETGTRAAPAGWESVG